MRRILPVLGLFFLSPLVAEFLLGNVSITAFFGLLALAPLYGGGAVLIREVVRRTGRGWPTILLLAVAYGVIEEGVATMSLFNPGYANAHLLEWAPIPALGIGGWWTVYVLTLHTVWSISVPIAMVEVFTGEDRPWLGRVGLTVITALFVVGVGVNLAFSVVTFHFVASVAQFAAAGVVVVALVVAAFLVGRRRATVTVDKPAPNAWLVGVLSLAVCSFFVGFTTLGGGKQLAWVAVGIYAVLYAGMIALVTYWSRRGGWGAAHKLALAGGALLSYAWHAFPQHPSIGAGTGDLVGNAVFATGAVVLLVFAVLHVRNRNAEPAEGEPSEQATT